MRHDSCHRRRFDQVKPVPVTDALQSHVANPLAQVLPMGCMMQKGESTMGRGLL